MNKKIIKGLFTNTFTFLMIPMLITMLYSKCSWIETDDGQPQPTTTTSTDDSNTTQPVDDNTSDEVTIIETDDQVDLLDPWTEPIINLPDTLEITDFAEFQSDADITVNWAKKISLQDTSETLRNKIVLHNGNIKIFGYSNFELYYDQGYNWDVEFDLSGNVISQNIYSSDIYTISSDCRYLADGRIFDGLKKIYDQSTKSYIYRSYIVREDSNGNISWEFERSNYVSSIDDVKILPNGNILVAGSKNGGAPDYAKSPAFLIISPSGTYVNSQILSVTEGAYNVITATDTSLTIGGYYYAYNPFIPYVITKEYDFDGVELENIQTQVSDPISVEFIFRTPDGGRLLISDGYFTMNGDLVDNVYNENRIVKLGPLIANTRNVETDVTLTDGLFDVHDILLTSAGNLYFLGDKELDPAALLDLNSAGINNLLIMKVNSLGQKLWEKKITSYDRTRYFFKLKEAPDGGILIWGLTQEGQSNTLTDSILIKFKNN